MGRIKKKVILTSADLGTNFGQNMVRINSVAEAYRKLASYAPDLLILDCELSDGTALDVLSYLRKANQCVPVVILSQEKPIHSTFTDRISLVYRFMEVLKLESLVRQKLGDQNRELYSIHEYVEFAKTALLTVEISICTNCMEECNRIVFHDGFIIDSKSGEYQGASALAKIFDLKNVDIRFKDPEPPTKKKEEDWNMMFFSMGDAPMSFDSLNPPSEGDDARMKHKSVSARMKHKSVSPRTTVGHGTGGVPFFVERTTLKSETPATKASLLFDDKTENGSILMFKPIFIDKEPEEPSIPIPDAQVDLPQINIEGLGIRELLDIATEEMLSRNYKVAHFILEAAMRIDPLNTTALANLDRLNELLKDKN